MAGSGSELKVNILFVKPSLHEQTDVCLQPNMTERFLSLHQQRHYKGHELINLTNSRSFNQIKLENTWASRQRPTPRIGKILTFGRWTPETKES